MDPDSQPASIKQRMVKGFALTMGAKLFVNMLAFVSSIIMARLLMPEDFGLVALAFGVNAIVMALTTFPIAEALIQASEVDDHHFHSAYTLGLIRACALTLFLALIAWPAALLYDDLRLIGILLVLALNALIGGFYSPRWPMIQKELSFGPSVMMTVSVRVVSLAIALPVAYFYRTYWAIVIPMTLTQLLSVAVTHAYAPYRPRLSMQRGRELWSFSVWMTFSAILNTVNQRIDTLLIGALLNHRAVGLYNYADDKAGLPSRELTEPLVQILFPGLAAVKDDPTRLASAYLRVQSLIFAICVPGGVGLALISDQFVHIFLGEKWLPIIPIMQVLAAVLALENLTVAAQPLAMAMGRTREIFRRDIAAFLFRTPSIVIGLALFGVTGVLVARAFSMLLNLGLYMRLVRKIADVRVRDQLGASSRSIAALGAMCLGVLLFKASPIMAMISPIVGLLASIALGGLFYVVGHAAIWLLAGRPNGPESEFLHTVRDMREKRRLRQGPAPA